MNEQSTEVEHLDKRSQESAALQNPILQMRKGEIFGPRSPVRAKKTTTWTAQVVLKVTILTLLFAALLSVDYSALALSSAILEAPIQVVVFAFVNTLLLSYFILSSCWTGWKELGAVVALLYGMVYVLTVAETFFLGSILSTRMVSGLIINGAIISTLFSGALVWTFGNKKQQPEVDSPRLQMPTREWIWKILALAVIYLALFMVFGVIVYMPLGRLLDPAAFASEQSIAAGAAALVFPIELVRGMFWALFAVPAILALPFDWKKTALIIGLLMAVPLTLSQFLSTAESLGLQIAHSAEIIGTNIAYGYLVVRILRIHSRLPADISPKPANS
jgi:hypothetical protein